MVEVYNMIISHSVNWSKTCLNISVCEKLSWKRKKYDNYDKNEVSDGRDGYLSDLCQ